METRFVDPLEETDLRVDSISSLLRYKSLSLKAVPSGFKQELSILIRKVFVSRSVRGDEHQANPQLLKKFMAGVF